MSKRTTLFACAFMAAQAFAGTPVMVATTPAVVAPKADPFFSGSFTAMYETNYTGRGLVTSRKGMEGEGAETLVLKLKHEIADSKWSYNPLIAYTVSSSGHTLYGNPTVNPEVLGYPAGTPMPHIKEANLENELVIVNEMRYSEEKWSVGIGHDFVHGGLLGVMAKHYADQGSSHVNEFFISPEYNPYPWLSLACPIRYSVDGVKGWWFEPSVTFKAPIIGTPEDLKLAALLSFNITATGDYFQDYHGANENGTQAFWIKLATPYFVNEAKTFIITPSVSFNWAGKGSLAANKNSEYKHYTGDDSYVPFQNFAVVGTISCTYVF